MRRRPRGMDGRGLGARRHPRRSGRRLRTIWIHRGRTWDLGDPEPDAQVADVPAAVRIILGRIERRRLNAECSVEDDRWARWSTSHVPTR